MYLTQGLHKALQLRPEAEAVRFMGQSLSFAQLEKAPRQVGLVFDDGRVRRAYLGVVTGALTCLILNWVPYVYFENSRGPPYRLSETLLFAPALGLTLGLFAGLFFGWLDQQLCLPAARRWARPASIE